MNVNKIIADVVRNWQDRSFSWDGACCLALCGAGVAALTGRDPTAALRQRYASETAAKRVMLAEGWADMADVAAALFPEIPLAQAKWGDLAFVPMGGGWGTLGIVCGPVVACRSEAGVVQVPRSSARRAFKVR